MLTRKEQSKIVDEIIKEAADKCPKDGCVGKKLNGSWGVMSNKTGKWWDANYKTKEDAEAGLRAYHVHKGSKKFTFKEMKLYAEAVRSIKGPRNAEKWLDNNSDKLEANVKNLQEAKREVYRVL